MYTVKPGTQTDTRVRLRGKGVPYLSGNRDRDVRDKANRGDHYVTLVVDVPTRLTDEQKELIKKLDDSFTGIKHESEEEHTKSGGKKKKIFGK